MPALPRRAAFGAPLLMPRPGRAAFPDRPIRALIGFPPGTPPDIAMRLLAPAMAERLGQPVVVENRPGASGALAAQALLRAPADGHTLLMMAAAALALPALQRQPPYDGEALRPIAGAAYAPMVLLLQPALGVADMANFLAFARLRGEALRYGHSGPASAPARAMGLLAEASGITPHGVGYRGDADVAMAVLSGQVQAGFAFLGSAMELIRDGRLRALAITSPERVAAFPNLPSMAELGMPEVDVIGSWAVTVPEQTPEATRQALIAAVRAARAAPGYAERLAMAGALPLTLDGPALLANYRRLRDDTVALLRRLGVQPE